MKRTLLTLLCVGSVVMSFAGSKVTYTTDITRDVAKTTTQPTAMRVSTNAIAEAFGLKSEEAVHRALADGTIQFLAKQGTLDKTYSSVSYGTYGFWFTATGLGTASNNVARRVACKYDGGYFYIIHNTDVNKKGLAYVNTGDHFTFAEMFVQGEDTVQYVFNLTICSDERIDSDQPDYVEMIDHRDDEIDGYKLQPLMRRNDGEWLAQNYIQVQEGDKITFHFGDKGDNTFYRARYKNKNKTLLPNSKYSDEPYVLTESATPEHSGYYYCDVNYKNVEKPSATYTQSSIRIYVDVQTKPLGTPWDWTGEVPQFGYDFHEEYPNLTPPTKVHTIKKKNGQPANQYVGKWWSVFWGDDLNDEVGGPEKAMEAAKNMVEMYDRDFEYIYENIGWPPNKSARDGYHSFIYIFGSGLANDNTDKNVDGGYQSATQTGEGWYACVWASYYPFSRFRSDADQKWGDGEFQREAMIHEGIHTLFADMDACKGSAWFHEGGNVWTQQELHARRDNSYGIPGYLNAGPLLCPFMPIECYSGWLQDGSFGGPSAEGVNMYGSDGQICTWRKLIGGTQYADVFPTVLASVAGSNSIGWIWRNCKNRILETIGEHIGDSAIRDLITQYRARLALFDIDGWSKGYRTVANDYFGVSVRAEYRNGVMTKANKESLEGPCWIDVEPFVVTPYQAVKKNSSDGWMAPDTLTNPGWSGANIIPLHVKSDADFAEVEFRPEDTNMRALLCYRTKKGTCHYSQPVTCGTMRIDLTEKPANGVIFCVPLNTDYQFLGGTYGENLRKHHFDYRIRLGENALAVADTYQRWYLYEEDIVDLDYITTDIESIHTNSRVVASEEPHVKVHGQYFSPGSIVNLHLEGVDAADVSVCVIDISGIMKSNTHLRNDGIYILPTELSHGLYLLRFEYKGKSNTYKIIIK